MSIPWSLRGLYAITPDALCEDARRLGLAAEAALRGGARLLQYRDKRGDAVTRRRLARLLLEACRRQGVPLIINDDVELCDELGASGVHLGRSDLPVAEARRRLGARAIVGVSCASRIEDAVRAEQSGASYVALGRFFPSRTKPDAPPATLAALRTAREQIQIPICAIGGITPDNAASLIEAGADMVAAVEGVFGAPDVEAAARAYARLFP